MKVLFTGASGFIGRNVVPYLRDKCDLLTPGRHELNLYDEVQVRDYIKDNKVDLVFHCANPNPIKNAIDHSETMFEDSIRMFMNLYTAQNLYRMMFSIGSGAEYDKSKEIIQVTEKDEFRSVPYDSYGLAKYTINRLISQSNKQCNLRLFGCYGPTDHSSKFITHVIRSCLNGESITIRQNCFFDYMQVMDLATAMGFFLYNKPQYRSYNVCSGKRVSLLAIAETVKLLMESKQEIIILRDGWNREYTASNERLLSEFPDWKTTSLEDGIRTQIEYERKVCETTL